jgi:hypothetical protein
MNDPDYQAIAKAIAPVIKEYFARSLAPVLQRLEALEGHGIKYCGVFQRAARYEKGSVVSDNGSAWIALRGVEGERPGESPMSWQLLVKRGRDGE